MDQDAHESVEQFQSAREHNRRAWDALVARRQRFTTPARDQDIANSPSIAARDAWLDGGVAGKRLLCLAAGGGRQGAFYAAAGADVTVVDISPEMLALDRQVAAERGLAIRAIQASMDDLSVLATGEFDIVLQPVSTCYVPDVTRVYREVSRVTRIGGIYVSQHKQPASLQADVRPATHGYELVEPYYRRGPLPPVVGSPHREEGTAEFLHRWEELVGGLCRSGFVIEDLMEPVHAEADAAPGTFPHRSRYVAPYVRIKARRVAPGRGATNGTASDSARLWTPS